MDAASVQLHNRLSALEQENAMLRLHLQHCEQAYAILQVEVAQYRRQEQEQAELVREQEPTYGQQQVHEHRQAGILQNHDLAGKTLHATADLFHHRLLEATANATNVLLTVKDIDQAIQTSLQILGQILEMDRIDVIENFAYSVDLAPAWRILYEWSSSEAISQSFDRNRTQGSYIEIQQLYEFFQQGQAISYLNEEAAERFYSQQVALEAKATHLVPIVVEGHWWGVLRMDNCRETKGYSLAALSAIKIAASGIGSAIQRERNQQALLKAEQACTRDVTQRFHKLEHHIDELQQALDCLIESEYRYRTLFEMSNEGIYRFELESPVSTALPLEEQTQLAIAAWRLTEANSAFCSQYGVEDATDLIGKSLIEFYGGEVTETTWQANLALVRSNYRIQGVETEEIGVDQQPRYFLHGMIGDIRDGYVLGGWGIQSDITELRKTQQALLKAEQERAAELEKASAALQRTIDAVGQLEQLDAFVPEVLRIVFEAFGACSCGYYEHPTDEQIYLRYWFHEGVIYKPDQLLALDIESFSTVRLLSQGFTVPIEYLGTPHRHRKHAVVIDHLHNTTVPEFHAFARGLGWGGELNVPLVCNGLALGALVIYRETSNFTDGEISLAESLGKQISLAMQTSQIAEREREMAIAREQERAAQERATELAKASDALKHSLDRLAQKSDLDTFLGHILGEMANQVQAVAGHIFLLNGETNTLELRLEIQNGQLYHQAQPDEPPLFQSAVPADITPIFQYLCQKRTLSFLSAGEFDGIAWAGTSEWVKREGFTEAVCLALIVGDQPVGILGLAFRDKIALKPEEAELIHALAHQATLAIHLTRLAEEAKQVAIFEERNRMASEIHDTLAQVFTGISLQLEVAKPLVYQEPETVERILEHISQLTKTGLAEARRSVWALYPPAAEYADLAQMLYNSVEHMTRNTAIAVEVNVQGEPCPLPPFIGMNLLRIGQEALTNALKHAQAQKISIELSYEPDRIWLTICDDGHGFNPPSHINSLNGGFGLVGMYERCDRIGAQLSISSQPEQGTQILVEALLI